MRNAIAWSFVASAAVLACSEPTAVVTSESDPPTSLEDARDRWQRLGLTSYEFATRFTCGLCAFPVFEPAIVRVSEGAVVQVRVQATGRRLPASDLASFYTIEELFQTIEDHEKAGDPTLRVEYHPAGYPVLLGVGSIANDSGWAITIGTVWRI